MECPTQKKPSSLVPSDQNCFEDFAMNKIITNFTEGSKTKLQDLAIRSCQTIQELLFEQKTVDKKTLTPSLDATEEYLTQLLWLARMLSEEGALSEFS